MFPFPFSFVAPTASGLADIDNVYSMEFDGVNDYFDLGTDSSLDIFGGDFSVSMWFNHTNASGNAVPLMQINTFTQKMAISLGFTINTGVGFAHWNGSASTWNYNAGSGLNDGNWHNIIATRTGATYKIYIDSVDTAYLTSAGYTYGSYNRIGTGRSAALYFNGKIDEVALFNYTLDQNQVDEIYNATSTGKTADLSTMATPPVAWYRMGD